MNSLQIISIEKIENKIFLIREQKVMIDSDLAELYGVSTKVLNQAVKRNIERFPVDFMFVLNKDEKNELVTNCDHLKKLKFSSALPKVFTDYGAIMLASILNSQRAVEASVYVVRAFVKLREILSTHKELGQKLKELEFKIETHDEQITSIIEAINQLLAPPPEPKRKMGFQVKEKKVLYKKI
ncbi:MAG: ORF6N domain-containing protein [Bacteroidetes bacterium]|nr:ORF6N domain-containing protein [Bacteroidota bacterium]